MNKQEPELVLGLDVAAVAEAEAKRGRVGREKVAQLAAPQRLKVGKMQTEMPTARGADVANEDEELPPSRS